ncbi:MAG: hypothetical protein M1812_004212 [Candelaria pacifica]|nr:MAG: hypothetical protein M1812_004212 [Candelaria pacifica]
MHFKEFNVGAALSLLLKSTLAQNTSALPVVDLGYELHQASFFNSTGQFYNFSNIRYAEAPIGARRFAAPVPVQTRNRTIQTGSVGVICPQASPAWFATAAQFIPAFVAGIPFNATNSSSSSNSRGGLLSNIPPQDPRTTEDCLFLDVVVPKQILEQSSNRSSRGAPVLVWIYGGGFTNGDKVGTGQNTANPAGLIKSSQSASATGVIYVSFNYRLGAFGWLAGPTLQSNGTANAGLLDQRLALQWVQDNISLFGGDPRKVTVIGESAGASSIEHQITAYGGTKAPFQQAVLQSPAFAPVPGNIQQETTFNTFLSLLNVSTIQEARLLPASKLILANILQVGYSPYGTWTYGPVVDGDFVAALPGKSLLQGSYDKSVKVMVGHNADEGLLFTNPAVNNASAYLAYVQSIFPDARPSVVTYIDQVLYPPVFNGTYGYTSHLTRAILTIADAAVNCNTDYLNRAYGNQTYNYLFSVPPAIHGQDVAYTYYNGPNPSILSSNVALALQRYITHFAETGNPNQPGVPNFGMAGNSSQILDLNITSIAEIRDETANSRCAWWQKALYY